MYYQETVLEVYGMDSSDIEHVGGKERVFLSKC